MAWIIDPSILVGFVTLIILEIVLGIDNIVFITILSDRLPYKIREKARIAGLIPALIMRIILLFSLSWLITLTKPIFILFGHKFSARDLIILIGGVFLLLKAIIELNDRLEGKDFYNNTQKKTSNFWAVVIQIIIIDAVFSIDSLITAVGIVDHVGIMIASLIISMLLMIWASKFLSDFVNNHQIIIVLCLSFLLMIGFTLVAEGLGYKIPKGYLYVAIGFSIMTETLNQFIQFSRRKILMNSRYLKKCTSEMVLRILSTKYENYELNDYIFDLINDQSIFKFQEKLMISRILGLTHRNVGSVMTSRYNIDYLDINKSTSELLKFIDKKPYSRLIVIDKTINNEPIGIIHMLCLIKQQLSGKSLNLRSLITKPLIFSEGISLLKAIEQFRNTQTHFAFVVDEFGLVEGIVTLTDVIKTIAGNLFVCNKKEDFCYDIQKIKNNI
ncbi:TerC family protein [Candidatus Providencia siddallii]|uniref:UPF0053 protein YegH, partial n=1 Tax=Candidatus Providencia siddallii TaxID=1715285 RepID=A0ABM9NN85_9GAMM